ncbi:MAG: glycosyltransferase [Anaerolineae bacterium]|nr:glycosyltransferase [Anaerolineae bacterium]
MFRPIDVRDIDLADSVPTLHQLTGHAVNVLVRWYGTPLGCVQVGVKNGVCSAETIRQALCEQISNDTVRLLVRDALPKLAEHTPDSGREWPSLEKSAEPPAIDHWPLVTVAVCTRNRSASLRHCLNALRRLDYPHLDILVVDNAPVDDATKALLSAEFPEMRYICEPIPGLNWARNQAISEAYGEIIAFTDDDVIVDPGWVRAVARLFRDDADVAAVTGLVLPLELQTEAQQLFEAYGGFGRGYRREWTRGYRFLSGFNGRYFVGSGRFGTGANMAFRTAIFQEIGYFDPALDVGTLTNGGGDLDMFFRVVHEGLTLVYEPQAIVRHRHRQTYGELHTQITNNGIGFYAHIVRNLRHYPREWRGITYLMIWWWLWWYGRRFLLSLQPSYTFPRDLIVTEFWGTFRGMLRYGRAQRQAKRRARQFGRKLPPVGRIHKFPHAAPPNAWLVHQIDLSESVAVPPDTETYHRVQVFVSWQGKLLGSAEFDNFHHPISDKEFMDGIADQLTPEILAAVTGQVSEDATSALMARLTQQTDDRSPAPVQPVLAALPDDQSVSIVVATYDRPAALRRCLQHIQQQQTSRTVELIVVDNNPTSGQSRFVIIDFPEVIYITEKRPGLSYARNAGIVASSGDIIVCADDDIVMPPDWLERLVAPFVDPDVMAVTGNVLPYRLDNRAQQLFEQYGGLGRGFEPRRTAYDWFVATRFRGLKTWELGATANAAFRATIYSHPEIGLLEEALGAGSPTGCSEDTYAFYQILRAGNTIVYEPTAYVWHEHRTSTAALRRQLFNYSKGHVAYHLLIWLKQHDRRSLFYLLVQLPIGHVYRLILWLLRQTDYPLRYHALEIAGQLMGPWALWRSQRRVERLGRSEPYVPVGRRGFSAEATRHNQTNKSLPIK